MQDTHDHQNQDTQPQRLCIEITGAVQGVGFRPFVYRLATELALTGWVINDTRGVFIEVEGEPARLTAFLERLPREAPPNARILRFTHVWQPPAGYKHFDIRHSDNAGTRSVLVLPDLATCAECRAELFDPANRRYRYPFTNCTHCGPRFTIVEALPYDRPNTTMHSFALCPDCQAEYANPLDRRFHAQPNACPVCGPEMAFYRRQGDKSTRGQGEAGSGSVGAVSTHGRLDEARWPAQCGEWQRTEVGDAALIAAVEAIRAGQIVAVKGLGGFHLMADARSEAAVTTLRTRKSRPDKPLAVMVRDVEQAASLCALSPLAAALLGSPAAPIVLLPRRPDAAIAAAVAPDNPDLGVLLPYTPLHHLLMTELDFPIIATSGNLSDEPICIDEWEALERLGAIADSFLLHDRPIARHADDSVIWLVDGAPQVLRRARGYAPLPVSAAQPLPTILAVGAHLKNTVALSVEDQIFLSQHIGDLESAPALSAFERVIADFLSLYETQPVAIAHDLHPEYLSTKWAVGREGDKKTRRQEEEGIETNRSRSHDAAASADRVSPSLLLPLSLSPRLIPVQHHHAHLAACLADNHASGPALGLIWDGTGYGSDGIIWGGECLLGDFAGFARVAHVRPFRLAGGEAAVREPRRVALALLWELFGDEVLGWDWLTPVRDFAEQERRLLAAMLARDVNSPRTTSMGRLFDGVAALIGLRQVVSFEGQAAMALEHCAVAGESKAYTFGIRAGAAGAPAVLDWAPLVEELLADLRGQVDAALMAARFHNALVNLGVAIAQKTGHPQVALSGGCFQNRRLTEHLARRLRSEGFDVLLHRQVPPNDGGISLGQVMVAADRLSSSPAF